MSSLDTPNQRHGSSVEHLYRHYRQWLIERLRPQYGDAADDLVQETYLRVAPYQQRGIINHPKALLLRIARNIAADQGRHATTAKAHRTGLARTTDRAEADQLDDLITKQMILSLPVEVRDVFVLNRVVGLTCQEVADRTGLTTKAVEWRLSRALIHCASHLER
jgi:RNA polymerase sigma factor (sigma-70 family)